MRLFVFMCCLAAMLFSSFSIEKPGSEEIIITGLRFNQARTEVLKKTPKQPAFTFDQKDVLRATKEYQIIYVKAEGVLIILPKTTSYSTYKKIDEYEHVELSDGTYIVCMCDTASGDNCHFSKHKDKDEFICTGSCGCWVGVLFPKNESPREYETAGGRWFNF